MYLSIIVPLYNAEKYLNECIDSLLEQTIEHYEIIFVNDASSDNSLDILKKYQREHCDKIVLISLPKRVKQGEARNIGLSKAKGEYVLFVDADDVVDSKMCEILYNEAKKTGAECVGCNYIETNENLSVLNKFKLQKIQYSKEDIELKKKQILNNFSLIPAKLFKLEFFKKHNLKFPADLYYEDKFMCMAVIYNLESFSCVDDYLYFYRRNPTSTTSKYLIENHQDKIKALKLTFEYVKNHKNYEKLKAVTDFAIMASILLSSNPYYNPSLRLFFSRIRFELDKIKFVKQNFKLNNSFTKDLKKKINFIFSYSLIYVIYEEIKNILYNEGFLKDKNLVNMKTVLKIPDNILIRLEKGIETTFLYNIDTEEVWTGNLSSYDIILQVDKKTSVEKIYKKNLQLFQGSKKNEIKNSIITLLSELTEKSFLERVS